MANFSKINAIEKKWRKIWQKEGIYKIKDKVKGKENFYHLVMFPYPSGDLHIGHWYNFAPADVFARFKRMQGYNVMSPFGFDAFGLPAENAAIKRKIHPKDWTYRNIKTMIEQLKSVGAMYDWSREIITSDPEYYKWTQWMFLQLFKNKLAYKKKAPANWCPKCHTVLANEQVVDGKCERCGTEVVQREINQWLFRITKYADRLLKDLDKLDWPEKTKIMQRNWIGKSEGVEIEFKIKKSELKINVFTTRVDTIFGCTYLVVAPEHPLIENNELGIKNYEEIKKYKEQAKKKTDLMRTDLAKEKTGVELKGIKAINPFNGEEVPIFTADYVLGHYGTGAVMAVPAHDERDFEFAKKYKLPIKKVIESCFYQYTEPGKIKENEPFVERDAIAVLVKHWEKNEYIGLKWKKVAWRTLITGGVEKGQTPEEAARAEVLEETGYKNLKLIKELSMVHSKFYHVPKKENRFAHFHVFYFELENREQQDISVEEKEIHEIVWVPKDKMEKYFTAESHNYIWQTLDKPETAYTADGVLNNSGEYNFLTSAEAREKMTAWLEKEEIGKKKINYKIRDWLVSRQRYWGAPIPIVYCDKCARRRQGFGGQGGWPVPEKDLPVKLPDVKNYLPTEEGKSPLAHSEKFVNAKCPKCGGKAKRETDTMDTFVCSSWYYLRYVDSKNSKKFADQKKIKEWLPVNMYVGGAEHAVLHLLYSRFFTKALKDFGYLNFSEPFSVLRHQGIILGSDGQKMSKSRGNVVDPDDLVKKFGSDVVRMYLCFMGPYDQGGPWNPGGILGVKRFLDKVWNYTNLWLKFKGKSADYNIDILLNKIIKKVGEDIENFRFNTAISQLMILMNEIAIPNSEDMPNSFIAQLINKDDLKRIIIILSPFAPHICEELWQMLGNKKSVFTEQWPKYNPKLIKEEEIELIIQVNGKFRDRILTDKGTDKTQAQELALNSQRVKRFISGKTVKNIIYIQDRLINIVV